MYQEQLQDRYEHPQFKGVLSHYSYESGVYNPSCADKIHFQVLLEGDVVVDIAYQTEGCVISGATADLLAEFIKGKSLQSCMTLSKEDLFALIGMQLGPNRFRCAYISVEALQDIYHKVHNNLSTDKS